MYVLIFSTNFPVAFFILRIIQLDTGINVHNVPDILVLVLVSLSLSLSWYLTSN